MAQIMSEEVLFAQSNKGFIWIATMRKSYNQQA